MIAKIIPFLISSLTLGAALHAEVVITRYDGPLPSQHSYDSRGIESHLEPARTALKRDDATTFYIIPFFKIDSTNPGGETTFVSIRNESETSQTVNFQLFPPDSASLQSIEMRTRVLLPKETWVLNLRSETELPPGEDGFIRGWARIFSGGRLSADFFQFNPSQDFATGGIPINVNEEVCKKVKVRFLLGGSFDGGTLLTLFNGSPNGTAPGNLPTVTGTVYAEDSTLANTFELRTDQFSLEINAEDLVLPGVNFGSMDIVFEGEFGNGAAFVEFKANDRFSVGTPAICLD